MRKWGSEEDVDSFSLTRAVLTSDFLLVLSKVGMLTKVAPESVLSLGPLKSEPVPELRIEVSGIMPSLALLRLSSSSLRLIASREMKMLENTVQSMPPLDLSVTKRVLLSPYT